MDHDLLGYTDFVPGASDGRASTREAAPDFDPASMADAYLEDARALRLA